jgi:hypothetical protein
MILKKLYALMMMSLFEEEFLISANYVHDAVPCELAFANLKKRTLILKIYQHVKGKCKIKFTLLPFLNLEF